MLTQRSDPTFPAGRKSKLPSAHSMLILDAAQFAVNDNDRYVAILEGMELAADLITRSTIVENLYLARRTKASSPGEHLEQALLRLYIKILGFMNDAIRYFEQSKLARIGKGLLQPAETTIQKNILEIIREQSNVDSSIHNVKAHLDQERDDAVDAQFVALGGLLSAMQTPTQELYDQMTVIIDDLQHERQSRLLDWLSSIPHSYYHDNMRKGRIAGTGRWLLKKQVYVDWKGSSQSSMLWLHGIPGCGKSKLISTVIDELKAQFSGQYEEFPILYFYFARDAAEKRRGDPDEAVRSIARQLCEFLKETTFLESTRESYREATSHGSEAAKIDMQSCKRLISRLVIQKKVFIIVDALDECDPLRRHEPMKLFESMLVWTDTTIKLFISSRDDSDIVKRLRVCPDIPIRKDDNTEDIRRFIREKLDEYIDDGRLLEGNISDDLKREITSDLEAGAQGMCVFIRYSIRSVLTWHIGSCGLACSWRISVTPSECLWRQTSGRNCSDFQNLLLTSMRRPAIRSNAPVHLRDI